MISRQAMLRVLAKNNLIAIVIHICLWPLIMFPAIFLDSDKPECVNAKIATGICLTLALVLYFGAGRRFLSNTNNVLTNAFSVTALAVILMLSIYLIYFEYYNILILPVLPLTLMIATFYRPEYPINDSVEFVLWLAMAILPSLAMWTGIITKRSNQNSQPSPNKYGENPKGR